jgi:hypothetical protein
MVFAARHWWAGEILSIIHHASARFVTTRCASDDISQFGPRRISVFGSRRGDDASRRAFQPRCYGRMHAGTERRVHVKVTGLAVSYAFDFR